VRFRISRTSGEEPPHPSVTEHLTFTCTAANGAIRHYSTRERAEQEIAKYGGNVSQIRPGPKWYSVEIKDMESLMRFCAEVGECVIGHDAESYAAPADDIGPLPMIEIYDGHRE